MFNQFSALMKEAGLLGLNMTIKPMSDTKISVVLSFLTSPLTEQKLFDESKDNGANIDNVILLKSALATPLVLVAEPKDLPAMLLEAINAIKSGLTEAVATYNSLDLSALLSTTSTNAAKANVKSEKPAPTKAEPAKQTKASSTDVANEVGSEAPVKAEAKVTNEPEQVITQSKFDDFDSL